MIRYHGTPITPSAACQRALTGRHGLVSFRSPQQIKLVAEVCDSFMLDNGAFSAWTAGEPVTDWRSYYDWCETWLRHPGCDFAVIPDVIEGNEADNDQLLDEWPFGTTSGLPVWHLHESFVRLESLMLAYPRVALGSSGDYATPGTAAWWGRIEDAMGVFCDADGVTRVKVHGLRMMRHELVDRIPFSSVDSSSIGRNIGLDVKWKGTWIPASPETRASILAERADALQSPAVWVPGAQQMELFGEVA